MDDAGDWLGPEGRIGGALCLDFVNTVDWHGSDHEGERLREYADLVRWAEYGGVLTGAQAAGLHAQAAQAPAAAAGILGEARALRESLFHILESMARQEAPAPDDLACLNRWIGTAGTQACLIPGDPGSLTWAWAEMEGRLDAPLWPVARSAADLLTGPHLARVHRCAEPDCGWMFLDTSKNGSRRWCSMAGCGSRAKARQYYRRKQAATR
jgi:predicted RNA-binding Zn ribbon-like protein